MSSSAEPDRLPVDPTITIISGGAFARLAELAIHFRLLMLLLFDVINEFRQRRFPSNAALFPLGVGQTSKTLLRWADLAVRRAAANFPGTDVNLGLGQFRQFGDLALGLQAVGGAFAAFLEQRLIPELAQKYPHLEHIRVEIKCSFAGGTGSKSGIKAGMLVSLAILEKSSATVHLSIDAIGARTTLSVAKRAGRNCAVAVVDILIVATENNDARETRSVILREIPDVGINRERRDLLVVETEQALNARDVKNELAARAPNNAFDGRFGNCRIVRADYHQALDVRTEVAPDVAERILQELLQLAETGREPRIDVLTVGAELIPEARESSESLAQRAPHSESNDILQAALRPCGKFRTHVGAVLIDGTTMSLDDPTRVFGVPPTSPQDAKERLGLQGDIKRHLEQTMDELEVRCQAALDETNDRKKELIQAILAVQGRLSWNPMTSANVLIRSAATRVQHLQESIDRVRESHDRSLELIAKFAALQATYAAMKSENEWLLHKIHRMAKTVAKFVPRQRRFTDAMVEPHGLEQTFRELWDVEGHVSESELLGVLIRGVRHVTMAGLARIVGAPEPRPEQIAQRLLAPQYATIGPAWSANPRRDEPVKFHVVPPIHPDFAAELRTFVKSIAPSEFLAVADCAPASLNVVDLNFYPVRSPKDALEGIYEAELIAAANDPDAPLYGFDLKKLAKLGIHIENGTIRYADLDEQEQS